MDSKELREKFIQFFVERGHKHLKPASLIPDDQSVLFTTAGMQQFKKYYIHPEEVPAKNVVTIQPCIRTSDIEEVGDKTHLTFFEMLGNFSFGGYFKKEAIELSYEFLTKELEIGPEKIYFSIFAGDEISPRDEESTEILKKMGIEYKEFPRKDCFWGPTGDEGPCGPAVEIYVDDVEIWTLVFNEYYFKDDKYQPLSPPGVDTGMGLERLVAVMQGKTDIYKTVLFLPIIQKIEEISGKKYNENQKEFRIIADHIKAAVFAINDSITPSNKEQGYIVRRLIRRIMVKLNNLDISRNILSDLAEKVFEIYKDTFEFNHENIIKEIQKEEIKFRNTLLNGLKEFEKQKRNLTGEIAFNLYQTYGFPLEMTAELAEENGIDVSRQDFEKAFKNHQELSRKSSAGMFRGGLSSGGEMETKYHTATHLLLASLRQILGDNVYQKGSNITAERLRFDFNWPEKLTAEQIRKIEDLMNEKIKENLLVKMEEIALEEAKKSGATGIFGLKYGDKVKVYTIGPSDKYFSHEICGGPHAKSTGVLGYFKIIKEESSSAGVRRIKAVLE